LLGLPFEILHEEGVIRCQRVWKFNSRLQAKQTTFASSLVLPCWK